MTKISRRKFLALGAAATLGCAATSSTYLYLHNESDQLVIERVQVPIRNLKSVLEGFTIVQLTDFHLYPLTQLDLVERAVAIANDLKPDLVVLTGDYVWHEAEAVFDLAPALAKLDARHGVFSIIGNHEIWTDLDAIKSAFAAEGLPILENQGLPLTVGQDTLYLAGVDDGWSGHPDLDAALTDLPNGAPVVLLAHEPDLADTFSQDGRVSLQLSGHSHGGQIRLPRVGAILLPYMAWKYDQGLYRVNDMWQYTNRGIGVTNEPVRFNCPPEITEITLVGM
ncbi:MAG: metallophosphoesterase [Chloroflexi bacterium]|nr:metallophosphoesterase [Chloroflexota bacterium]